MQSHRVEHNVAEWNAWRGSEDDRLYECYGRQLEAEHYGKFVAISGDGHLIRGTDDFTVATEVLRQFGSGTFALRRIGADAEITWRTLTSRI